MADLTSGVKKGELVLWPTYSNASTTYILFSLIVAPVFCTYLICKFAGIPIGSFAMDVLHSGLGAINNTLSMIGWR